MKNVEINTNGNIVTITFDKSRSLGPSKSGKTILVASTEGSQRLDETCYMIMSAYRYLEEEKKA